MFKRNFPLILFALLFVALLDVLFQIPCYKPLKIDTPSDDKDIPTHSFVGRMNMPSLDDIYVIENSANRDIEKISNFIQGRAAGLHWLGLKDVSISLKLKIDSTGRFFCLESSEVKNQELVKKLQKHIEYYWRYTKSTNGETIFWIPFRWKIKPSK